MSLSRASPTLSPASTPRSACLLDRGPPGHAAVRLLLPAAQVLAGNIGCAACGSQPGMRPAIRSWSLSLSMLRVFTDACHRHGWLPRLAPGAVIYVEELPPHHDQVARFIRDPRPARPRPPGLAGRRPVAVPRHHRQRRRLQPVLAPHLLPAARALAAGHRPAR